MLQKIREKLHNTQRGAIMVFFAILVPFFLGMIGFAVDAGFLYMQKAKLQDIADAAALAGAGHLEDANDPSRANVTSAVGAFAEANGFKDKNATSSRFIYGSSYTTDDITLGQNDDWKIAQRVDENSTDKYDNRDPHPHVRVLIVKKVPTFFIRILFPDQKDVTVKALAVAEYVKGSEPQPVASDIPGLMAYSGSLEFHSSSIYGSHGKGIDTDLYIFSGLMVKDNELPLYGSYYAQNEFSSIKLMGDKEKNKYKPFWWGDYGNDEQKKEIRDVKDKIEKLHSSCESFMRSVNVESYKNGDGNKVYIDRFGIMPKNIIINPNTEYDVYIDASNMAMDPAKDEWGDGRSIICNRYLNGIKKINNLFVTSSTGSSILNTEGITYNNVYLNVGSFIEGKNNYFNGVIYNHDQVSFMGENNHYAQVLANNIRIGYGYHFDTGREGAAYSDWKCYFGSSNGSSSDSSGSTTAHVRLVK